MATTKKSAVATPARTSFWIAVGKDEEVYSGYTKDDAVTNFEDSLGTSPVMVIEVELDHLKDRKIPAFYVDAM